MRNHTHTYAPRTRPVFSWTRFFFFAIAVVVVLAILGAASPRASAASVVEPRTDVFTSVAGHVQVNATGTPGTQIRVLVDGKRWGTTKSIPASGTLSMQLATGQGLFAVTPQWRPPSSKWSTPWTSMNTVLVKVWPSTSYSRWGLIRVL